MEKLYFSNSIITAATTSSTSSSSSSSSTTGTAGTTGTIGLGNDSTQSTIGLLTTVAALPLKYKIRYVTPETPLDLSVCKQNVMIDDVSTITPPCTPPSPIKKRILEIESLNTMTLKNINLMKKYDIKRENLNENESNNNNNNEHDVINVDMADHTLKHHENETKLFESKSMEMQVHNRKEQKTPNNKKTYSKKFNSDNSPIKSITTISKSQQNPSSNSNFTIKERKLKAIRKLKFDDDKSSPVSGTIIRSLNDIINNITDGTAVVAASVGNNNNNNNINNNNNNNNNNSNAIESGDIDPEYNIVEVTEEAKAELALIPNVIGSYTCKLCRLEFDDAFCLARHRCSCIILLEYRCPECGKRFNCPANLASHRRWHKPKNELLTQKQKGLNGNAQLKSKNKPSPSTNHNSNSDDQQQQQLLFTCTECNKSFKRNAYLRKHLQSHTNLNKENTNNNNNNKNLICIKSETQNDNIIEYNMDDEDDDGEDFIENDNIMFDDSKSNDSNSNNNNNNNSHHDEYIKYQYNNNNNNNNISNFQSISPSISPTTSSISTSSVMSATSPSHRKYHIYENSFTEAENIAASALAHLRNGPSVIRHTTTLSV